MLFSIEKLGWLFSMETLELLGVIVVMLIFGLMINKSKEGKF